MNTKINSVNFSNAKVLVIGDVMLDQYWHGETSRISPEAPVPVVKVNGLDARPGGAANVAINLAALGCDVSLLGIVGTDQNATELRELLELAKVNAELLAIPEYNTITKLRVLSRHQQMIRLDHEDLEIPQQHIKELHEIYIGLVKASDIVVLSDYAKGVLADPQLFIKTATSLGVQVLVDPKNSDFSAYAGTSVIKPNLKEFEEIVGKITDEEDLVAKARDLLVKNQIGSIVITRGSEGMTVVNSDTVETIPSYSGEVFDVTGAGDTVMSLLAAGLASRMSLNKAAYFGAHAAGIVVGKVGTSTVTLQELKSSILAKDNVKLGFVSVEEAITSIQTCQAHGEKIVFVNGCYDIIHHAHIKYLQTASAFGDRLVLGLNSDSSVKQLKGPDRPIHNQEQRATVLAALKCVDWVVLFEETAPGKLVEALSPDIIVKTDENFPTVADIPNTEGVEHVLARGGEVHLISRTEGCSSTGLIEYVVGTTK